MRYFRVVREVVVTIATILSALAGIIRAVWPNGLSH